MMPLTANQRRGLLALVSEGRRQQSDWPTQSWKQGFDLDEFKKHGLRPAVVLTNSLADKNAVVAPDALKASLSTSVARFCVVNPLFGRPL
jgi:hypothetical protein